MKSSLLNRAVMRLLWLGLAGIIFAAAGTLVISGQQTPPSASDSIEPVKGEEIPTGKFLTPTAATGATVQDLNPGHVTAPDVRADGPASLAVSPDGKWLAILAGGYNSFSDRDGRSSPELSTEYVFLFDITGAQPKQIQVFPIRASFQGLTWAPSSNQLFASGGIDDEVREFVRNGSSFVAGRTLRLGHKSWVGPDPKEPGAVWTENGLCLECKGEVGGLAMSPDGTRLLVANVLNDSVSLIDISSGRIIAEQDLRPGIIDPTRHGQPGGSYPRAVAWSSPTRAYVASERDREIISLAVAGGKMKVIHRMPVLGQPVALLANQSGSRLYVALDTTNGVTIFETADDKQIESLDVVAPDSIYTNSKKLGGANTNALALTPDERTLLVSNGGENAVAVVQLGNPARDMAAGNRKGSNRDGDDDQTDRNRSAVMGLVPTGWYPSGLATSKAGTTWYVINGKSPTGPNVSWCKEADPASKLCVGLRTSDKYFDIFGMNQHLAQLEKAVLLTIPVPSPLDLARLTRQVARNNGFDRPDKTADDERLFAFLRQHIKHVIYIMKENVTYDMILGDLEVGNGDPRLTLFPDKITPNHHAIARNFVDLDNTLVSGEGSPQGWTWTYAAQTTDYNERNEPHFYASHGVLSDEYGRNRSINMGYATGKERHAERSAEPSDPDILPGAHDVNAPDGPGDLEGEGYIWDAALRKGLTVRNWGLGALPFWTYPFIRDPYAQKQRVFWAAKSSLIPRSDPYFFPFNVAYPDYWRVREWKREFAGFSAAGSAPNLMVMWLGGDHTGAFDKAIDGVNTPEAQVADNDYALGLIIDTVAKSPFARDTLIVSIEDDAWNGPDHVDSHRTLALVAGAYVRQHAVVSTRYTTVSLVKTIEEILGTGPIGLNDALASPMSDVFDPNTNSWSYKAIVPNVLRSTQLPLPHDDHAQIEYPRHVAAYWAKIMGGQDFSGPDRLEPASFQRALWRGLKGDEAYPEKPTGADLRVNRPQLLARVKPVGGSRQVGRQSQ